MDDRDLATYYARGRVVIGILLVLFPRRIMAGVAGGRDEVTPFVRLLARLVGVRDAIVGAGALAALQEGDPARIRPWMTYGALADGGDAVATILAYRNLPRLQRFGLLCMALSGAGAGGYRVTKFV
jgi:hypothetical protein